MQVLLMENGRDVVIFSGFGGGRVGCLCAGCPRGRAAGALHFAAAPGDFGGHAREPRRPGRNWRPHPAAGKYVPVVVKTNGTIFGIGEFTTHLKPILGFLF